MEPVTKADVPKIVGIDPGQTGAMAFLSTDAELVAIEDLPYIGKLLNARMFANLIIGLGPVRTVILEQAQTMPKQGIVGAFNYGMAYGKMHGVLATLNITVVEWSTAWKKRAKLSNDKDLSRRRATERWPEWAEYFKRKMDDGRAEASLMADLWLNENPQRRRVIRRLGQP